MRSGTFDAISILPPRCSRKVRSETRPTSTPSIAFSPSVICAACALEYAAIVTSIRSRSFPEPDTSSAVISPPASSTVRVSLDTALPRDGASRRTVYE